MKLNTGNYFVNCVSAVGVVMSKRPIRIMDTLVDVDVLTPCLEDGEVLGSISVTGIHEKMAEDLRNICLEDRKGIVEYTLSLLLCSLIIFI